MEGLNILTVPIIGAAVYASMTVLKKAIHDNEKIKRCIPLIAMLLGIALSVIAFYAMPEVIPSDNIFMTILTGGASGLAATGTNQAIKQLDKFKKDEEPNGESRD